MGYHQQLASLIEPAVSALQCELWGCELIQHGHKRAELWVYVEKAPHGVTVDQCAEISRQVSAVLDVEDVISSAYQLQVSSPGMDRSLFTPAQYQQYQGARVKCRLKIPLEGRRNFIGVMTAVTDDSVTLQLDDAALTFAFSQIERANVIPEF